MEKRKLYDNEKEIVIEEKKIPLDVVIKLLDNLINEGIRIVYGDDNMCHIPLNKDDLSFIKEKIIEDVKVEFVQRNEEDEISKIVVVDFIR